MTMLVLTTPTARGPLSGRKCAASTSSPLKFITKPDSDFCSSRVSDSCPGLVKPPRRRVVLTLAKADGSVNSKPSTSVSPPSQSPFAGDETIFVGQENVPLEGVIQFDKPSSSSSVISKWGRVALLAGGDVLALLLFSAIGRFNHGLPLFSFDILHTADPFIAGWFLSAYFLGGYAEDGRGMKGRSKAVIAAAKSWIAGVPLGLVIRSATSGHIPPSSFILVTMGSTAVLLIGWRALLFSVLPNESKKKDDTYRRGNPFELFELLTSLIRRW
ncbi:PREDICTED: uncharacterized protein LOC104799830 [Tarenaya hassleriana]|uniref:uncharacterized protein LOC104799830 n=1 Tax=Tarenaya hassleriana TaxID=28532 RepID=UPI00053C3A88|nr:PREDICTED: uncharacterized protein LOC104799830 [Tarenaya hassleriana]